MVRPFAVIGFTVFFTTALLFEFETGVTVAALTLFAVALVISLLVKKIRKQRAFPVAFASGTIACVLLLCTVNFTYLPALAYNGKTCFLIAEITGVPEIKYGNYYYEARALSIDGEQADVKIRLNFSTPPEAEPYDIIEGNFNLYALGSSSEEIMQSYKAKGVFLGAYPQTDDYSVITVPESEKPFAKTILDIRTAIKSAVYRVLPDERGALAVALLIGDKSGLSAETIADFQLAGISHVICVSGLHLSLWSMLILNILKKTKLNEQLAYALAIPVVILFMLIAGMTYSVVRSGIMMLVFLVGNIIMRRRDSLNSLGFALALMGVINPFLLGSVSLKLSALSTLGIILYSQFIEPHIKEKTAEIRNKAVASAIQKLVSSLMITVSATALTLPISLSIYGGFNFAVFAANLVAVPVAGMSMVICALGAATGTFLTNIFNPIVFSGGFLCRFLIWFSDVIADIEFLTFRITNDKSAVLLCGLFLLCFIAVMFTYAGNKVSQIACILCAIMFTVTLVFSSVIEKGETKIRVVDCGNGTSVLVSSGGENLLIGCGGTEFLGSMYIGEAADNIGGRFDAVFVHDSSESSCGYLNKILADYRPERIYCNELPSGSELLLGNTLKHSFSDSYISENISVKTAYAKNNYCLLLKNKDIVLMICFDPVFDFSQLPEEFRRADVIITRNDYPSGVEFSGCSLVVVNSENNRGVLIQNELSAKGLNCVATGGCGDIVIRAKKEISVPSESKNSRKGYIMPILNESALKEKLRANPVGVYLIYGEESYLKKIYIDKIISKTVDAAFEDFNFHTFEGKECTLSEIYESAEAVPMMAETKCVLVKDFPLDTLDDNGFEQLERVVCENPDDCALVFSFVAYEPKGAKWNKAVKLFEKNGYAVKLDKKTVPELIKVLESGAKKREKPFAKGAASYLVTCVGSDLNTLLNEMEKVCAYATGEEVLKSDIDAVCIKSLDAKVFDMIKDLTAGKFDSAFRKLSLLFEQREDEFQILGALIAQYSDIYRAKAAVKSGNRAEMIAKYYNYSGKEFRLTNAARNGSSLSFDDIGECIEILSWADKTLKSSALDKRLVLEQTVVKLARVGRR